MSGENKATKRPVGRPRADGKAHLNRETLLKTTAKLIAANGYSGTSIRMIASALDASTASIFNLYPSKEKLLNALIAFAASPSLEFYEKLNELSAPPPVALFKSIFEETRAVASVDRDYVAMFYLPELRRPEFTEAQSVRARMVEHYATLIRKGIEGGLFRNVDPQWAAEQVFQLSETSILTDGLSTPEEAVNKALETADFCLRGLMTSHESMEQIERDCAQIDLSIEVDR